VLSRIVLGAASASGNRLDTGKEWWLTEIDARSLLVPGDVIDRGGVDLGRGIKPSIGGTGNSLSRRVLAVECDEDGLEVEPRLDPAPGVPYRAGIGGTGGMLYSL
jgi:hypothetical protein